MATAVNSDFLNGGTSDLNNPFSSYTLPPVPTVDNQQRAQQLSQNAAFNGNVNNGAYRADRATSDALAGMSPEHIMQLYESGQAGPDGLAITAGQYAAAKNLHDQNARANNSTAYKVLTGGILAAPAAVTGGAAAFGGPEALGFGQGAGTLVDTGAQASEPIVQMTNEAGTAAAAGMEPGSAGIPGAAAVPGAAPAAAPGVATTAAPSLLDKTLTSLGIGAIGTAAKIGVDKALGGGETSADKALIDKQKQLAQEATGRYQDQARQRMSGVAQQVAALAPWNNWLRQVTGGQGGYTPQQAAAMVTNPIAPTIDQNLLHPADPNKLTQDQLKQIQQYWQQMDAYNQGNQQNQQMVTSAFAPQPIQGPPQMAAPLAAKKYF